MGICSVEGCDQKTRANGLCNKHNMRMRLTGTTDPGPKAHASLEERFWRHVARRSAGECWPWTGKRRSANGYGIIQIGGKGSKSTGAHRVSFELHKQAIPPGLVVMHTCDNPECVNPDHLALGTYQDNMADMWSKGRGRPAIILGEASGKAKLTDEWVRFIRAKSQMGHKELADLIGVSPNAVRGVRTGRTWKHIE